MLSWWATHGKHVDSYKAYEEAGKRMGVLDNQPSIFSGNEWFFDAFVALGTCRGPSMSGVPEIPWTACDAYARRLDLDDEGAQILWAVIHRADTAYRAEVNKHSG